MTKITKSLFVVFSLANLAFLKGSDADKNAEGDFPLLTVDDGFETLIPDLPNTEEIDCYNVENTIIEPLEGEVVNIGVVDIFQTAENNENVEIESSIEGEVINEVVDIFENVENIENYENIENILVENCENIEVENFIEGEVINEVVDIFENIENILVENIENIEGENYENMEENIEEYIQEPNFVELPDGGLLIVNQEHFSVVDYHSEDPEEVNNTNFQDEILNNTQAEVVEINEKGFLGSN